MNEYAGLKLIEQKGIYYLGDPELSANWHGKYIAPFARGSKTMNRDEERTIYAAQAQERDQLRAAFARSCGLVQKHRTGCEVHKLINPRSRKCLVVGSNNCPEVRDNPDALGWRDHTELWYSPKRRAYTLTTQPYSLTLASYQALEKWCATNGLQCSVSYTGAWWYPGWTALVVIHGNPM